MNASLKLFRKSVFLLGAVSVLGGVSVAQAASTVLLPGAWSSDFRVMINSKDSTVLLQQAQKDLALSLPVGMKEGALATLNAAKTLGNASTCLTAATVAANSTPSALFTSLSKMNPRCRFTPVRSTNSTQFFAGRCDDPTGFTGNVTGKLYVVSPSSWQSDFVGVGRVPDVALAALSLPAGTTVQMKTVSTSRFVSATCAAPVVAAK